MQPTGWQVRRTRAVVQWYLQVHWGRRTEPGMPAMYTDPRQVGHYAVELPALRDGAPEALQRVFMATVMFQRLRDALVLKILQQVPLEAVQEMTSPPRLLELAKDSGCPHAASVESLRTACDLQKDSSGAGVCTAEPRRSCALKRHTVLLRRYGHFGKVPTSFALGLQEAGVEDLPGLYRQATTGRSPQDASVWLEERLSESWRVSSKIACMFLSLVSNPDILPGAPWQAGLDWRRFVVIDSNVDLFLERTGYTGRQTYQARRDFVTALADRVPLQVYEPSLQDRNPRIVQQAMYLFMSASNRKLLAHDCVHLQPQSCVSCSPVVRSACTLGP